MKLQLAFPYSYEPLRLDNHKISSDGTKHTFLTCEFVYNAKEKTRGKDFKAWWGFSFCGTEI